MDADATEVVMNSGRRSLRRAVEKWIDPERLTRVQIVRPGCSKYGRAGLIRVEGESGSRPFAIFFFRHEDGSWQVFPPSMHRPVIGLGLAKRAALPKGD
ncbi:hypothetical protein [Burkholderia pseudomultivorans]|uniref:hypothetical protein n=1 Tax=Burkholderia pseudomultivorans TaxID=1207504 RepID=UPI0012D8646A|nr:hypothetical protein [Burkholderia pseudomultivorans]